MWSIHRTSVARTASKATISSDGSALLFSEILDLLKSSRDFRGFFIAALLDAPFQAFFWEAPAVTLSSIDLPFEFVQTDAPGLAGVSADPEPFAGHFSGCSSRSVLSFPNLGKDALLVVPKPMGELSVYCHLASFLRGAPPD